VLPGPQASQIAWGPFSCQRFGHSMAADAQLLGDAALAEARAVEAANCLGARFGEVSDEQDGQEQQGQGPGREAGGGHCSECCGVISQGAAPAPG